jgi:hypothetical protein
MQVSNSGSLLNSKAGSGSVLTSKAGSGYRYILRPIREPQTQKITMGHSVDPDPKRMSPKFTIPR